MLVTSDSNGEEGRLPTLSDEVIASVADKMMQGLRAKHGRAPTLAEAQEAMLELTAVALGMLHAEHGRVNSLEAPNVEGQHDDGDSS